MKNVIDDGIERIESNPMLETNYNIQQQWKFAENEIVKRRQTYKKEIGSLIPYAMNIIKSRKSNKSKRKRKSALKKAISKKSKRTEKD